MYLCTSKQFCNFKMLKKYSEVAEKLSRTPHCTEFTAGLSVGSWDLKITSLYFTSTQLRSHPPKSLITRLPYLCSLKLFKCTEQQHTLVALPPPFLHKHSCRETDHQQILLHQYPLLQMGAQKFKGENYIITVPSEPHPHALHSCPETKSFVLTY